MGKNKLAKFDDMACYKHVFQYSFEQLKETPFPLRGQWGTDFFHNDHPIVIELGCGRGEYTVGLAAQYPDKNFIGIDIKGARMWTGATEAYEKGMTNVAFLRTRIELLTDFFAPGEVSEIWITFPDPQMKKVNKRLTCTRFLERYHEVLKPGGLVHLKSDSNFLFTYTEAVAEINRLPIVCKTRDLNGSFQMTDDKELQSLIDIPSVRNIQTYYESQWVGRGIPIKYLCFQLKKPLLWTEPDIEIELDSYRSYGREKRSALDTHI